MRISRKVAAGVVVVLLVLVLLGQLAINRTSTNKTAINQTTLPRILFVMSAYRPATTFEPYFYLPSSTGYGAAPLITDLLERGIVPNVTATQIYVNMDRSKYDIIVFQGYSNPVPVDVLASAMQKDLQAGKKLIFIGASIFNQTDTSGRTIAGRSALTLIGMPTNTPLVGQLRPVLSGSDDFEKLGAPSLRTVDTEYFAALPIRTVAYIGNSTHYYLLMTSLGAWIAPRVVLNLDFGKVIAKLWWGSTDAGFGFSLDRLDGKPIVVWRVDGDDSRMCQELQDVGNLAANAHIKATVGAKGSAIAAKPSVVPCWQQLGRNPYIEIAVHSYNHGFGHAGWNVDLLYDEVGKTYNMLVSDNIPSKKIFIGWDSCMWNSTQIQEIYDAGWRMTLGCEGQLRLNSKCVSNGWCEGSGKRYSYYDNYEGIGLHDPVSVYPVANFTDGPAIIGVNGHSDYNAYAGDVNFTSTNQRAFRQITDRMLPFIPLTHDYLMLSSYNNSYGNLASQEFAFFNWLGQEPISSLWISEYLQLYFSANRATITRNGDTFTVTRDGPVNDMKIYVGTAEPHVVGPSVLSQTIVGGWLYVTLRSEPAGTFTLAPETVSTVTVVPTTTATPEARPTVTVTTAGTCKFASELPVRS